MADPGQDEYPTRRTGGDYAKGAGRAVVGAVPFAGPALQELMNLVSDPLQKRRDQWFRNLGEGLAELQKRLDGFYPHRLAENEVFVDTVATATQSAIKTHRQEKLDALRNAVLNVAAGVTLDEVLRARFLSLIDVYSTLHLHLLQVLQNPRAIEYLRKKGETRMGALHGILAEYFQVERGVSSESMDAAFSDLERDGLVNGSIKAMTTGNGLLAKRTSERGDAFLAFISAPG